MASARTTRVAVDRAGHKAATKSELSGSRRIAYKGSATEPGDQIRTLIEELIVRASTSAPVEPRRSWPPPKGGHHEPPPLIGRNMSGVGAATEAEILCDALRHVKCLTCGQHWARPPASSAARPWRPDRHGRRDLATSWTRRAPPPHRDRGDHWRRRSAGLPAVRCREHAAPPPLLGHATSGYLIEAAIHHALKLKLVVSALRHGGRAPWSPKAARERGRWVLPLPPPRMSAGGRARGDDRD